jgi:hypothetical protein
MMMMSDLLTTMVQLVQFGPTLVLKRQSDALSVLWFNTTRMGSVVPRHALPIATPSHNICELAHSCNQGSSLGTDSSLVDTRKYV